MERTEFVTTLKNLSSALAKKDTVPVFQCFCFDGKRVHAYDDVVGIEKAFPFAIPGAYRGEHLLSWANSAKGKEIVIEEKQADEGKAVTFVCGRSRITLAQIPTISFLFKKPDKDSAVTLGIDDSVIGSIAKVLPCVSRDTTHPWQHGVTIYFSKKAVRFYATNENSAAYTSIAGLPEGIEPGTAILLPPRFCDLLVEFAKRSSLSKFVVHDDGVVATFSDGNKLYSRIGNEHDVEKYKMLFSSEQLRELSEVLKPCPTGFKSAIGRVSIVLDRGDSHTITMKVRDGKMTIKGASAVGESSDVVKVPDHADSEGEINPEFLKPAIDTMEEIALVGPRFFAARGDGTTYLFSLIHDGSAEEKE